MAKKATNKELQNDIIKLYDSTKRGLDSLLFTLWEYIKWKGDGEDFKKFCDDMNNQAKESLDDKKADGGKD
tara:strand:+ start:1007 stop:1219 length:213 start_codon:yes stop_codon:yes gene_type:complete